VRVCDPSPAHPASVTTASTTRPARVRTDAAYGPYAALSWSC
jgi:hypothetical protein